MKVKHLIYALFAIALVWSCSSDDDSTAPTAKAPKISGFSPSSGTVGTLVTITGTNFATEKADNTVKFGAATATVGSATATQLKVTVPVGATTNKITVTVDGDTATSTTVFTVTEVEPTNGAPVMADQEFSVAEDMTEEDEIGQVEATDPEDDTLTFGIVENDNDLFTISGAGKLTLAEGKSLDFETAAEHTITVSVGDGNKSTTANITIQVTNVNEAPEFGEETYKFEVAEDIDDTEVIGIMDATDGDGDGLTFNIAENDNELFEISDDGEITLAEGKSLDFETTEVHMITVAVTDGTETVEMEITVGVTNVIENMFEDPTSFITTWNIPEDNFELEIGINAFDYAYEFTIDWGDGTIEDLTLSDIIGVFTHVYATAGTYTVAIQGDFPTIVMYYANNASRSSLVSIDQWGSIAWESFYEAFRNCENMEYHATDVPDLSNVTYMSYMFRGASSFNGDLSDWDVGNVTDMEYMFHEASSFNGNLSGWDVGNVTDMRNMFSYASSFNGDLSDWDVGNVTTMRSMFRGTSSFNTDISGWNPINVTDMVFMFSEAEAFDQNLGNWHINSITAMDEMFDDSGLSAANYDATLTGWIQKGSTPNNIVLGASGINYCNGGPRAGLINQKGWTINDAGQDCN